MEDVGVLSEVQFLKHEKERDLLSADWWLRMYGRQIFGWCTKKHSHVCVEISTYKIPKPFDWKTSSQQVMFIANFHATSWRLDIIFSIHILYNNQITSFFLVPNSSLEFPKSLIQHPTRTRLLKLRTWSMHLPRHPQESTELGGWIFHIGSFLMKINKLQISPLSLLE